MDYPKLISEKWNLTAKFNCLQAIYFDAPIALAVPMCDFLLVHPIRGAYAVQNQNVHLV